MLVVVEGTTHKDVVWAEVESGDEGLHGVEVGHPVADVLGKLHSLTDVDLHLCTHTHTHTHGTIYGSDNVCCYLVPAIYIITHTHTRVAYTVAGTLYYVCMQYSLNVKVCNPLTH